MTDPPPTSHPPTAPGPIPTQNAPSLADTVGMRMVLPVGRSPWAIAAGYAGLFSVLLVPAPLAVVLGIVAIIHIKRRPRTYGLGRAIFGVVMGLAGSAILVLSLLQM